MLALHKSAQLVPLILYLFLLRDRQVQNQCTFNTHAIQLHDAMCGTIKTHENQTNTLIDDSKGNLEHKHDT
jgi:hypothetical protein